MPTDFISRLNELAQTARSEAEWQERLTALRKEAAAQAAAHTFDNTHQVERNKVIGSRWVSGCVTMEELAKEYGISTTRVRQIVNKYCNRTNLRRLR